MKTPRALTNELGELTPYACNMSETSLQYKSN